MIQKTRSTILGALAIVTSLLCNKWFLEQAIVDNQWLLDRAIIEDGVIEGLPKLAAIALFQVLTFCFGAWLLRSGTKRTFPGPIYFLVMVGLLAPCAVGVYGGLTATYVIGTSREYRQAWYQMEGSENLLTALTPELMQLSEGLLNLELPDDRNSPLFGDTVFVADLKAPAEAAEVHSLPGDIDAWDWPYNKGTYEIPRDLLSMWEPLLAQVLHWESAKFYFITGQFTDMDRDQFDTVVGFAGLARFVDGQMVSVATKQRVIWRPGPPREDDGEPWRIAEWHTKKAKIQDTPSLLFEEVLERALPADEARRARHCLHQDLAMKFFSERETTEFPEFFDLWAFDRQPGVSVTDINADGFSDIYVTARFGRNELFINQGDGTFIEDAAAYGLDIDSHTSSSIFADFDNDGDVDAFLGRTHARSQYMVNENGRFVDRSDWFDVPLPHLTSSVSVVDYDGDGLLDVYVSTYAYRLGMKGREAYGRFLPSADADSLERLYHGDVSDIYLSFPGPPNRLFRNVGDGRFVYATDVPALKLFWNTWQSTWSDYDGDGDADVYVSNDFAPNQLLQNEGNGQFVDVTAQSGTVDHGFGMGASWGDYDQDGLQDLYTTNMFSKAGKRITAQIPGLDPRLSKMARGNSLFRNEVDSFDHVSGMEAPALTVEAGGWGWSGQFADVDNDTYLDIYSLSGFYTSVASMLPRDT